MPSPTSDKATALPSHQASEGFGPIKVLAQLAPIICAVFSVIPLLLNWRYFRRLIWFGDDYDLLNQIRLHGFWSWTVSPFAENFVPVFKTLWGTLAFMSGGNYSVMIAALWITHAVNVALAVKLMTALGASPIATVGTVGAFAISSYTHETLGWSVQWSAILCTTFFLLALLLLHRAFEANKLRRIDSIALFGLAALSVLSFSRGFVVCGALFCGCLLGAYKNRDYLKRWVVTAFLTLLPAFGAAAVLFQLADGNHQQLLSGETNKLLSILQFGSTALALNPLDRIFGGDFSTPSISAQSIQFGILIKLVALSLALYFYSKCSATVRVVLIVALFEIGNSILLGIGRHHTGQSLSLSSRYQYEYLLTCSLVLSLVFSGMLRNCGHIVRGIFLFSAILAWIYLSQDWPSTAQQWMQWRGREGVQAVRNLEASTNDQARESRWIGFTPFLTDQELRDVRAYFHLTPRVKERAK